MSTQHISKLKIEQKYISIFASGNSLKELPNEDVEEIYAKSFLITMNYGPVNFPCHMNIWSDKLVTDFMIDHFKTHPKDHITLARFQAFDYRNPIHVNFRDSYLDYTYDTKQDKISGCYTIVFLIQILQKFFPDKIILVFGVDMNDINSKWYDSFTDWDSKKRGNNNYIHNKVRESCNQITTNTKNVNIFNCNPNSNYKIWTKKDYKELLNG